MKTVKALKIVKKALKDKNAEVQISKGILSYSDKETILNIVLDDFEKEGVYTVFELVNSLYRLESNLRTLELQPVVELTGEKITLPKISFKDNPYLVERFDFLEIKNSMQSFVNGHYLSRKEVEIKKDYLVSFKVCRAFSGLKNIEVVSSEKNNWVGLRAKDVFFVKKSQIRFPILESVIPRLNEENGIDVDVEPLRKRMKEIVKSCKINTNRCLKFSLTEEEIVYDGISLGKNEVLPCNGEVRLNPANLLMAITQIEGTVKFHQFDLSNGLKSYCFQDGNAISLVMACKN